MIQHQDSHLDHALTPAQVAHVLERFADRQSFFIETITLPRELGTVPCGLYGPAMGDSPIGEDEVTHAARGTRAWPSRLVDLPPRQQHELTVIAGPHEETCPRCKGTGETFHIDLGFGPFNQTLTCHKCDGAKVLKHVCILFTAFGGPAAPQEPGDPGCKDVEASRKLWAEHALAAPVK
jgi:hypothetical protein